MSNIKYFPESQVVRKSNDAKFRMERIEKLINELRYEIERAIVTEDISEPFGAKYHLAGNFTLDIRMIRNRVGPFKGE